MLKNYIKVALRHFTTYKANSFINLFGLSIGIASACIIGLYIASEWSFDKYHVHANRVFRVAAEMHLGDKAFHGTDCSRLLKEEASQTFGEIAKAARLDTYSAINKVRYKDQFFWKDRFALADPEVFDIFSFPWISGNQQTALKAPFSVVLTHSLAKKYFGTENPIDKVLYFDKNDQSYALKVTGVMRRLAP